MSDMKNPLFEDLDAKLEPVVQPKNEVAIETVLKQIEM